MSGGAATKTPESLTAASRAAQLGATPPTAGGKVSIADVRARMALAVERPANAAADLKIGEDSDGSMAILPVMAIRAYEHNPRVTENPKYAEIKESIRAQGVTNQISVTKRPGEQHYICAAGGNTRLQIVQELWQETQDPRWSQLTVKYRAWRGEAAVIAAHLAENEGRGDTSYWEKANGLGKLKTEIERDQQGKVLTSQELHKEAKRLGMDFGLTLVQNLMFAVEYLAPIGPWLNARAVKEHLQPTIVGVQGLCDQIEPLRKADLRSAIRTCLESQADYLHAQTAESIAGQGTPTLDAPQVVQAINDAAAGVLQVPPVRLPLLLSARAANPRIQAVELRRLADQAQAQQVAPAAREQANQSGAVGGGQQLPLRPPMLAPVAPVSPVARPPSFDASATAPSSGAIEDGSRVSPLERLLDSLLRGLAEVGQACELDDVLSSCPTLPLGFFVELPDAGIETINGEPATNVMLRKAAWHLMAALSGQWVPEVARLIPAEQSRWRALLDSGDLFREASLLTMAEVGTAGRALLWGEDVARLLLHPELGARMAQVLAVACEVRRTHPERFPASMAALG